LRAESNPFEHAARPDLEEFLSALDGFLVTQKDQKATSDLSYFKFLGIFCRSIGAREGHFVRSGSGNLQSIFSFGMGAEFDKEFNASVPPGPHALCPLETALKQKEVIAVVDLSKDPDIPEWFMNIMKRRNFGSLVAVPILGRKDPTGVMCAYYHDICLFDQGILDHLMMIGRLVGAATEMESASKPTKPEGLEILDQIEGHYLQWLTTKSNDKLDVCMTVCKLAHTFLEATGVVCGLVHQTGGEMSLTIIGLSGIDGKLLSQRFLIPAQIKASFLSDKKGGIISMQENDWQGFRTFITYHAPHGLVKPLIWQGQLSGAILAWRSQAIPFGPLHEKGLERLAFLTALALN